jgi:hypothetical protein
MVPPPKSTATPPETPLVYWSNLEDSHYTPNEAIPVSTGVAMHCGFLNLEKWSVKYAHLVNRDVSLPESAPGNQKQSVNESVKVAAPPHLWFLERLIR